VCSVAKPKTKIVDYQEYFQSAQRASQQAEAGDYESALSILLSLVSNDISDLDKSMMCLNIAILLERMGRESEVLSWYEKGVSYEWPHSRCKVAENKAAYLARQGKPKESLSIYETLLMRQFLMEEDKNRIRAHSDAERTVAE
jgi:tetratricopeptide (TPR) repeat protein